VFKPKVASRPQPLQDPVFKPKVATSRQPKLQDRVSRIASPSRPNFPKLVASHKNNKMDPRLRLVDQLVKVLVVVAHL